MTTLLEFIGNLIEGVQLIALALSVGGLLYPLTALRPAIADPTVREAALAHSLRLTAIGVAVLALACGLHLLIKALALRVVLGGAAWFAFARTEVFAVGTLGIILAGGLFLAVGWLRHDPSLSTRWAVALGLAGAFLVNEAWLSHASSRLEQRGSLVALTALHVIGATAWAGGIGHLLLFRRFIRRRPDAAVWWPALVAQFSVLGELSVGLLFGAGLVLAFSYVGTASGLVGTGYGNMLAAKVSLFVFMLALAGLNFLAARQWQHTRRLATLQKAVPPYIEAEALLAIALFFMAAALTSFPPAVDVPEHTATPGEMLHMFAPKRPHLSGPQVALVEAPELTDPVTGRVGTQEEPMWDRFNHNVSGAILLAMAGLAWLDRTRTVTWARHWPALFVGFGVLTVIIANPDDWPLGTRPIRDSLKNPEVIQHWIAALVMCGLGWFEWRARREEAARTVLPYVFPLLVMAGGLVLLTHSHQIRELKQEFLTQSTHVAMGVLAVISGCARWLELRLPPPRDRVAGHIAIAAMALIGFILLFYVSPGVVYVRNLWK